jgi:hypothetical protein
MIELKKYIADSFGIEIEIEPFSKNDLRLLPLYLKGNFELYHGRLGEIKVIWSSEGVDAEITPDKLENQGRQLERLFKEPIVFIIPHLDSWMRKRLIEKRVAFVQPFKQLYIPQLLIELNDIAKRGKVPVEKKEYISHPAQFALLYHLEHRILEGKTFQNIAETLEYSAMTITRLTRELASHQWIHIAGGKEKSISFVLRGEKLWNGIFSHLRSPVMEKWFYDDPLYTEAFLESGEAALSQYTMLSGPETNYHAIGKEAFRSLRALNQLPPLHQQFGKHVLEVWHYDPLLLVEKGSGVVDKLSLYLSLQNQTDERVISALDELINTIGW